MHITDSETLLFTGDSITDCGRSRPLGAGSELGDGYVKFADGLIASRYPDRHVRILNTGISGNTVVDLEARWQVDVLDLKPDWLVMLIGINDVWRQFDGDFGFDQIGIQRFESTYRNILERVRPMLRGIVLMSPYYIEANLSDPMRQCMDKYGLVVQRLAHEFDAIFVDLQEEFDLHLVHLATPLHGGDGIHPNELGHIIISKSFLTAMHFDWRLAKKSTS